MSRLKDIFLCTLCCGYGRCPRDSGIIYNINVEEELAGTSHVECSNGLTTSIQSNVRWDPQPHESTVGIWTIFIEVEIFFKD